ncbi:MAG: hypothetical protein HKP09_00070 [Enterobacterales bacterium]|nr:hypothetical protein [Enterobacterales bacterium]
MIRLTQLMLIFLLSACDSGTNNTKTPEEIQADTEASQKAFKMNQQRIQAESKAQEEQLLVQRNYIGVRLVSVDEEFLEVELSNETNKDVDNISGSLDVLSSDGNYVTGIALTNWVPGDIYLATGNTTLARKSLALEPPEKRNEIINNAVNYRYRYTVLRIQFAGEEEINYQASINQPVVSKPVAKTVIEPIQEVNRASPEACADNQVTLETEAVFYAWPDCEHIGRNIESEVSKLEYINMCKTELGITGHLPYVAKVQVSSCIHETSRRGLTYKKRICCDLPADAK